MGLINLKIENSIKLEIKSKKFDVCFIWISETGQSVLDQQQLNAIFN
ncbi:hypothetical protein DFA_06799 [Cavenderia fasciculata]|uniref:Uncharacterized protein n=1 Tax=Cavenderia fasciculata TaxID=261658 RepID=F4Q2B2_CACFS|nr:uncharacterized protein DFA_06799 [Cavenderia fasciculata]EGG18132.1 hypothetical protein DFA_06799 [Cavenderia fasciculata]|eukprot:XP_004366173.1 hypothetical protein DFA_06799 [Cavenderia fasciculata]